MRGSTRTLGVLFINLRYRHRYRISAVSKFCPQVCLAALALRTKAEQTIDMAKKRTKSDKAQRQSEGLEKKLERRPAQVPKKKAA